MKLFETDIEDAHGNIVIQKDLKVRHKGSQLEYTVEDVIDSGGEPQIILRLPEEPRFDSNQGQDKMIVSKKSANKEVIYEYEISSDGSDYYFPAEEEETIEPVDPSEEPTEMISVSKEEFEKEYEVK